MIYLVSGPDPIAKCGREQRWINRGTGNGGSLLKSLPEFLWHIQLTCNNDAHTLESILDLGAKMGFEVTWDEKKSEPNPTMVAS